MKVLGLRPPGDAFSYELYNNLVADSTTPAIYVWGGSFNTAFDRARLTQLNTILNDVVGDIFVCIRDHFSREEYNFSQGSKTDMSITLTEWATAHPQQTMVLFTALEELDRELADVKNIKVVRLGGDITNHKTGYTTVDPVLDKNLDSDRWFVSLNRNARFHRVALVSLLYAMNLDRNGYITFLDHDFFRYDNFLDHVNWTFTTEHDLVRQLCIDGFPAMKRVYGVENDVYTKVYGTSQNNNVENFNLNLRKIYCNSFIEIVSETTVVEPAFLLTEKTLNSIYGCNFPIMISGQGAVGLLREMGMDVFDDVIDHSYDNISDPLLRMHQAIELNSTLLRDGDLVKNLWQKNKQRFINNVAFARNQLYNFYITRAKADFCQAMFDINK